MIYEPPQTYEIPENIWGVPKKRGTPKSIQIIHFSGIFPYKPRHFWVPPFMETPIEARPG